MFISNYLLNLTLVELDPITLEGAADFASLMRPNPANNFSSLLLNKTSMINDATTAVYHFSTPNVKVYYPEPFIATSTFHHNDMWFIHIGIYQYWLWFFFIFLIIYFVLMFIVTLRWANIRSKPRRETRGVSRSKCGDLITATVPVTWATSIIVHESTDAIEFYDGFGTTDMAIGIRAFQWGWEYYYPKTLRRSPGNTPVQVGHTLAQQQQDNYGSAIGSFVKNSQTALTNSNLFGGGSDTFDIAQDDKWSLVWKNHSPLLDRTKLNVAFRRIYSSTQTLQFFRNYKLRAPQLTSLTSLSCVASRDLIANKSSLQFTNLPQHTLTSRDLKATQTVDITPITLQLLVGALPTYPFQALRLFPFTHPRSPNSQPLLGLTAASTPIGQYFSLIEGQAEIASFLHEYLNSTNLFRGAARTDLTVTSNLSTEFGIFFQAWAQTSPRNPSEVSLASQLPLAKMSSSELYPSTFVTLPKYLKEAELDVLSYFSDYLVGVNLYNTLSPTKKTLTSYHYNYNFVPLSSTLNRLTPLFPELVHNDLGDIERGELPLVFLKQTLPTDSNEEAALSTILGFVGDPYNTTRGYASTLEQTLTAHSDLLPTFEPFADLDFLRAVSFTKFENLWWDLSLSEVDLAITQTLLNSTPQYTKLTQSDSALTSFSHLLENNTPLNLLLAVEPRYTSYPLDFFTRIAVKEFPDFMTTTLPNSLLSPVTTTPLGWVSTLMNFLFVAQNTTDSLGTQSFYKFMASFVKLNNWTHYPIVGLSAPVDTLPTATQPLFSPLMFWDSNSQEQISFRSGFTSELKMNSQLSLVKSAQVFKINDSSIWKVFRSAFFDKKSAFTLSFYDYSVVKLPTLMKPLPSWGSTVTKTDNSFLRTLLLKPYFSSTVTDLTFIEGWLHNLNSYFTFEFPFSTAFESDIIRYAWFDWYSRRSMRTVKASDLSKYGLNGAALPVKFFDYQSDDFEAITSESNYIQNLTKSRRFYLPMSVYSYFLHQTEHINSLHTYLSLNLDFLTKINSITYSLYYLPQSKLNTNLSTHVRPNSSDTVLALPGRPWNYTINTTSPWNSTTALLKVNDILIKREWVYRYVFAKHNFALTLSDNIASNLSNPLLKLIASITPLPEHTPQPYQTFPLNKTGVLGVKNQYKPMRRGITSMLKLHAEAAVALPTETRLQLLSLSKDIIHSWAVPSAGIKIDCVPGYSSHRVIIFFLSGIYWGQCMEICGRFHHWMPIVVYFMKRDLFFIWCSHFILNTEAAVNNTSNFEVRDVPHTVSYSSTSWL